MRRRRTATIVAMMGVAGVAAAEPSACEVAGSDQAVVQGRLGLLEGIGPAAFIVTVPTGVCLKGATPVDSVEKAMSVQLYATTAEGYQDLYRLVGEKVYVRGRMSGTKSFQQKAPILMEVLDIATR